MERVEQTSLSLEVYAADTGAYQRVQVDPLGTPQPIVVAGRNFGTFPRQADEVYSWLLRKHAKELRAYRIQGERELRATILPQDALLYGCDCGVISAFRGASELFCLNCGLQRISVDHHCRHLPRTIRFLLTREECGYCGEHASRMIADDSESTVEKRSVIVHPSMQALSLTEPRAVAANLRNNRANLPSLVLVFFLILLVVFAGVYIFNGERELGKNLARAVDRGDVLTPEKSSLVHYCTEVLEEVPRGGLRTLIEGRYVPLIRREAAQRLDYVYTRSRGDLAAWKEVERAYKLLYRLTEVETDRARLLLIRGEQLRWQRSEGALNKADHILKLFASASERSPDWSLPLNSIAEIYLQRASQVASPRDELEIAKEKLEAAVGCEPPLASVHRQLAEIAFSEGDVRGAICAMNAAVGIEPLNSGLQTLRFKYLAFAGDCAEIHRLMSRGNFRPEVKRIVAGIAEEKCK